MRTIEESMLANSQNWAPYYNGGPQMLHLLRRYSYSDRVRYYWNDASVKQALETLCRNLEQHPILETLLSAFLPEEYAAVRCGKLQAQPIQIVQHRIRQVLASYTQACRSTVCTA
jgi:D-tagatose-1,6-bisphosphate aldolase subunit GatZ/KbaZ